MPKKILSNTSISSSEKYVKKDPISHVLDRPDMYVGSRLERSTEEYICDENFYVSQRLVRSSPAIVRIFVEILSNAIDNVVRSKINGKYKPTCLKIDIDKKTGKTTIWNDGEFIPINIHSIENCYNHTLIFGHFMTSSNYDDTQERLLSGRNGEGAKLTNVHSTYFKVVGVDPEQKKKLTQVWKNNMKDIEEVIVEDNCVQKGFTQIEYIPDFSLFNLKNYTEDILSIYRKLMLDSAMLTKLPVFYNGDELPVHTLLEYAKMYKDDCYEYFEKSESINSEEESEVEEKSISSNNNNKKEELFITTKDCEIVLLPSTKSHIVSFVNGIYTSLGGTHVDAWTEALFRPIIEKFNKKDKPQINIKDVKNCFKLFVVASIPNPKFESQSKNKLEEPNVIPIVKKTDITKILKWDVMTDLEEMIKQKDLESIQKIERKKRGFQKIDLLEPANNEGGKLGRECTLIIVEGDSAKTYAIKGLKIGAFGKSGRDWFGVYKLRGKVLNCLTSTPSIISKNVIISGLIKSINLKVNVDYTIKENFDTLRYGRVLIITDADVDGIHISGLLQNFFYTLFPSLLQRKDAFIASMQTPIAKVELQKSYKLFYDAREYEKFCDEWYKNNQNKKLDVKYYKGLGTSDNIMISRTFGKKLVNLEGDEKTSITMNKVFHKKHADTRKDWLQKYDPRDIRLSFKGDEEEIINFKISDFLETELIKFSIDDCERSIPCVIDGLKISQRKILYSAFLKKLNYTNKKSLKVAQFSAYSAEKTAYHHGEGGLDKTIINMAQGFVGTNNVPLLYDDGQFGSRNSDTDKASPRYISTKLEKLTKLLFRESDMPLLKQKEDDGMKIEPEYFVPILPTILLNGSVGIGTGWSCNVPCFNPIEVAEAVKSWIAKRKSIPYNKISLKPWYRGFKGVFEKETEKRYMCKGIIEIVDGKTCVITEIPIGMSIVKLRDILSELVEKKEIKNFVDHSGADTPNFTITEFSTGGMVCTIKNLKLFSWITLTNMSLFNVENKLHRYSSVEELLNEFCLCRYDLYEKRKIYLVKQFEYELKIVKNKKRFLEELCDRKISLFSDETKKPKPKNELIQELRDKKYDELNEKLEKLENNEEESEYDESLEEKENKKGFEYLLSMKFSSATKEKIEEYTREFNKLSKNFELLQKKSIEEMWCEELDEFIREYPIWEKEWEDRHKLDDDEVENNNKRKSKKKK